MRRYPGRPSEAWDGRPGRQCFGQGSGWHRATSIGIELDELAGFVQHPVLVVEEADRAVRTDARGQECEGVGGWQGVPRIGAIEVELTIHPHAVQARDPDPGRLEILRRHEIRSKFNSGRILDFGMKKVADDMPWHAG